MTTIISLLVLSECDDYTIGGYEFNENRDFISIYDQDSTKHTYKYIELDEDNFCLEHWKYETVSKNGLSYKKAENKRLE